MVCYLIYLVDKFLRVALAAVMGITIADVCEPGRFLKRLFSWSVVTAL